MGDQQETRLENLSEAIAKAVESEIEAGGINAKDVLAVLCGVIAWVISDTSPERHSELQSYLTAQIPKMVEEGRKTQAQILKDKSH
jgi:hypothetical protein